MSAKNPLFCETADFLYCIFDNLMIRLIYQHYLKESEDFL